MWKKISNTFHSILVVKNRDIPKKKRKTTRGFQKKPSKRDIEDKRWDRYCYLDDESAFRYFMICLWIYLYTYLWSYVTRISPYMSRCMVLFFEKKNLRLLDEKPIHGRPSDAPLDLVLERGQGQTSLVLESTGMIFWKNSAILTMVQFQSHTMHGTGIFTYMNGWYVW